VLDAEVAPGWAARHGIQYDSLEALAANAEVQAAIADGVEQAMAGFNNAERVKKWTLLTEEWQPDSELLTPTFKLKRRGVNQTFAAEIEALYA
jgi:long-chain acyl-CoA synthetase